jgi:hypothetical protein
LVTRNGEKILAEPQVDPIKVATKRDKNHPISKKKGDGDPWKIL